MNAQEALSQILWQSRLFVKDIITEVATDPNQYSMRFEVSDGCVKLLVHNNNTKQIVGKAYTLKNFLTLCKENKLEYQLNYDVRQILVYSLDETTKKVRWL